MISPDNSKAYVVLRQDQKVVEITGLHDGTPAVGTERRSSALEPTWESR